MIDDWITSNRPLYAGFIISRSDVEYTAKELREAWVQACLSEVGVRSVGDEERITEYFRGIGWGWAIEQHCPGGVYDDAIRRRLGRRGPLNFCGIGPAFAAHCLIGDHLEDGMCVPVRLKRGIAYYVMPSTYRIQSAGRWAKSGAEQAPRVTLEDLRRGDIATVRTGANLSTGDHIVMVTGRSKGQIGTVEFNAHGDLGGGNTGRGVVERVRNLDDVVRVYRFDERHFEGAQ